MSILETLFDCEIVKRNAEQLFEFLSVRFPFGKYLVLTDEESALTVGGALQRLPKKIMLVLKEREDLRSLFLLHDGVTCVVGAGKAAAAARYFADVRSLPFVAVCFSCAPSGLMRRKVSLKIFEEEAVYPVRKTSLIFADVGSMSANTGGIREAKAFLAACRLSLFAFDVSREFFLRTGEESCEVVRPGEPCGGCGNHAGELRPLLKAASEPLFSSDCEAATSFLFDSVLTAEYCFENGFPEGEIFDLYRTAECLGDAGRFKENRGVGTEEGELLSLCCLYLSELYALFFENGFYRSGSVDYNARHERAKRLVGDKGGRIRAMNVPSAEVLKERAEIFRQVKEKYFLEISGILNALKEMFSDIQGRKETVLSGILRFLPEISLSPCRVTALMRDFSLL